MRRMLVLTILSLSLLSSSARADQVTLKNGDRLSGTIVKSDDDAKTLLIKTDLAGDVTIKWDTVTAIVSSQPLHITLSDGRVVAGTVTTTEGNLEIATKDAGTVSATHDAVKAIRNDAQQAEIDRLQHPRLRDLKTWLGWQVTVSDRYISDPPIGLKGNDFLLSTGLRLTFGKGIF
jgi:small nuclear ribonucleoprotein (snRNP)-like protein